MADIARLRAHGGMNGYIHPAMSVFRHILPLICGALLFASCSGPVPRDSLRSAALPNSESATEAWSTRQAQAHVSFLDGADLEGRESATRGFSRTASYIAARLKGFGIQPVLAAEYRLQYAAQTSAVTQSSIQLVTPDSLDLIRGEDYLVSGLSESLRMSGQGRLPQNVAGLHWNARLDSLSRNSTWDWRISIDVESGINLASMHIAGFLPGAKPQERDSLIILVAPVDGLGMQGISSWSDGTDTSLPSAALLEVTRRLSELERSWSLFGQTVMIVFASRTRSDCSGVDALLKHLPWDRTYVRAIHLLDARHPQACRWQESIAEHGINSSRLLFHQVNTPAINPSVAGFGTWFPRSDLLRSATIDPAVAEVLRVAENVMNAMPIE